MANTLQGVDSVTMVALDKAVGSKQVKEAREELNPGSYNVNCLLRLTGAVKVGEDYQQNKTASMPQMKMLLAALMLNGISVRSFVKRYLDGEFEVTPDQEKEMKDIWKELADNYNSTFKGKVTSAVTVEAVSEADAA